MKYINAERLKELLDGKYKEFTEKTKKDCPLQYQYMADGLDIAEQFIDSLQQEHQKNDLNVDIKNLHPNYKKPKKNWSSFVDIANYFYKLGLNAKEEKI